MARFSLACYVVSVKVAWRSDEYLRLGEFSLDESLLDLFVRYVEELEASHSNDVDHQNLFKIRHSSLDRSCVCGIVDAGNYGYTAELVDVNMHSRSYRRKTSDAELMPYYFLACLPSEARRGVFILQRSSRHGIRTLLDGFEEYFRREFPDYRISINPLVSKKLLDQYLKGGSLTKIRFFKFSLPTEIANAYESEGTVEIGGKAELVLSPGRGESFPLMNRIRDVALGRREIGAIYELVEGEYDNVKIEIRLGGNSRTIDLSETMRMRSYIDISDEVRVDGDGHPQFSSINGIARDLLRDLLVEIRQGNEHVG